MTSSGCCGFELAQLADAARRTRRRRARARRGRSSARCGSRSARATPARAAASCRRFLRRLTRPRREPNERLGPDDRLRADGELRGRGLVVHAVADLAREQHRALGLARAVAGEPARGRDERLLAQPHRIAAAARQLAPDVEQRLPQRRRVLADRAVRRDRAPGDPAVAVEEPAQTRPRRRARARRRRSGRRPVRRRARAARRRRRTRARRWRSRARPARPTAGRSRARGRSARSSSRHCTERGLVEEQHERAAPAARGDEPCDGAWPSRATTPCRDRERELGRDARRRRARRRASAVR